MYLGASACLIGPVYGRNNADRVCGPLKQMAHMMCDLLNNILDVLEFAFDVRLREYFVVDNMVGCRLCVAYIGEMSLQNECPLSAFGDASIDDSSGFAVAVLVRGLSSISGGRHGSNVLSFGDNDDCQLGHW